MRTLKPDHPAISIRQLLVIADRIRKAESGITLPDFMEAIKCRVVRLGFAYPSADLLTDVISKLPVTSTPLEEVTVPKSPETRPLTRQEAQTVLTALTERFHRDVRSALKSTGHPDRRDR